MDWGLGFPWVPPTIIDAMVGALGAGRSFRVWSVRGNVGDLRGGKERVLLFRSRFSDGDPARGHD